MSSDNPSGADNQQERPSSSDWMNRISLDLGNWVAGFVDGEGSFNVPIRRERDRGLPWRVSLSFNVSQVGPELPTLLLETFGIGTVRGRGDGVFYFEVTRPNALAERVFPFFERFPLRSPKQADLAVFRQITELVQLGRHLSPAWHRRDLEVEITDEPGWQETVRRELHPRRTLGAGILRGHTQSSTREAGWMKIWSTLYGDIGITGTITVNPGRG